MTEGPSDKHPLREMEPVKVLYLITELHAGGAEKMLFELARRLDLRRFLPIVASLRSGGRYAEKLEDAGIPVFSLRMRFKYDPGGPLRLRRLIRQVSPEILHTFLFHANLLGRLAGRSAGVPLVVSSVRVMEEERSHHLFLDRLTSRLVDVETCNCEASRAFTVKRAGIPAEKLVVIPNGIDLSSVPKPSSSAPLRRELGLGEDAPVLGFAGRLDPQKGLEVLMDAFSYVAAAEPRAVLVLVGRGPLEEKLRRLAGDLGMNERIVFAGFRESVWEWMNLFDLFVLPSRWEGMPNAVLEAMALSKPVVATRVGGVGEMVLHGETGLLVEKGDAGGFSGSILRLLRDPALRENMGRAGRKRAEESFSIERMVKAHEALYEKLLRRKGHAKARD